MTEYQRGVEASIRIVEKYSKDHQIIHAILRDLEKLKKKEDGKRSY